MAPFKILALSALLALAAAQETVTRTDDKIQPSASATSVGPIQTNRACGMISEVVEDSNLEYPIVTAELAYACLQSVPIVANAASSVIEDLKKMVQFQSNIAYLKSPPKGYANDPVDIVKGLDDIDDKIKNGSYQNQYDFEADIANLLAKSYDGHLSFEGMAFSGVFGWRRPRQISLISASQDGKAPKIWAVQDFNQTAAGFTPSAITQINGKNAVEFVEEESKAHQYHDADTRFNAMFYSPSAELFGLFVSPRYYPGPSMNISFENGTTRNIENNAVVLDSSAWEYITNGRTFYQTYIALSSGSKRKIKKRSPHALPIPLDHPKDESLSRRSNPVGYPKPAVVHSVDDVPLAGYFINTAVGLVGVLVIQTFNVAENSDAEEFQTVIQTFLEQCGKRGAKKVVVDLRNNGGGKILLGYDAFKQFFPSDEPQLLSRFRGHDASQVLGESLSTFKNLNSLNGDMYTSPFNYHSYVNKDLKPFTSWHDMYPPEVHNNDKFTALLRYNLSDPLITSDTRFSIGLSITGYEDRSNFTIAPFEKDSIILLSDGLCSSTCALFIELMVQQAGVKAITVGGRPRNGPMQTVGGTKGSLVLPHRYLVQLGQSVLTTFARTNSQARNWTTFLPISTFAINYNDATVNFQDNIRKGLESEGVPTQFINDTSACKIWFTPSMYTNVTELWSAVAETAWGDDGKIDEKKCVAGSVTTPEQQKGQGDTSDPTGEAKPKKPKINAATSFTRRAEQDVWMPMLACMGVVLASMGFGASLLW